MTLEKFNIRHSPMVRSYKVEEDKLGRPQVKQERLLIKGQGTIAVKLSKLSLTETSPFFCIEWKTNNSSNSDYAFIMELTHGSIIFYEQNGKTKKELLKQESPDIALDIDNNCPYWFSFDSHNKILRCGKGEIRKLTTLAEYTYQSSTQPNNENSNNWLHEIQNVSLTGCISSFDVWRDPVVVDPPLTIVASDEMTMDMAVNYTSTVPANLTQECQKLYANICGKNFKINSPDFPEFVDAVAQSIQDPRGWCYKKLREKASEFGDEKATYLRITMGENQGESPGVPYVLTIWPAGHYSPIHNHAGANGIIRVLHGEVTVELFPFLSPNHQIPYIKKTLYKDNVTWLSPKFNQTHRVINHSKKGCLCITVECYLYSFDDNSHYEYFDYIDTKGNQICHFDPASDMDFIEFKQRMKEEWEELHTPKQNMN